MERIILNLCGREEIGQKLTAFASEYVLVPGTCRNNRITLSDDLDGLFLVVTDSNEHLAMICADERLPIAMPLLFFCPDDNPPLFVNGSHFIDVLPWPCPENLLRHKLAFLRQLFRFCHQREMFLKTYDTLIDSLSRRDGLTGLYNRHHLLRQLEDELQKARARASNLSLLILDLDNFRQVNQSYGYSFGDNLLGELSARISGTVREASGICCRYCGGSLAVILPQTAADEAMRCAERIRMACCAKGFRRGKQTIHVSLSIGIASFQENHPHDSDQFIAITEAALYQAKNDGRNRIRVFSEEMSQQNISAGTGVSMLKFTINSLLQNTRATVISSLMSLTRDLGGNEQRRHSALVSRYLSLMAKDMALPAGLLKTFENTTNLLTCVRVLLRQDILTRSGQFTDTERKLMRELPYKTAELTENFDFFLEERTLLLTQSECFDGSGDPHGLIGDEIPFSARLFKLMDAFAAMTADRPHRGRLSAQAIVDELTEQAGRQFDPALVLRLLTLIQRQHLLRIDGDTLRQARQRLHERFPDIDDGRKK